MQKSIIFVAWVGVMQAVAAPVYFTFKGSVNFVPQDQGGYAAAHGVARGSAVTYVLKVDTAADGYDLNQGVKEVQADIPDSGTGYSANYFFDSLMTPSLFSSAINDPLNGSFLGYRTHTVIGSLSRSSAVLQVTVGTQDTGVQVFLYLPDTSAHFLPKLGDTIQATESYTRGSSVSTSATATVYVTAISNTPPAALGKGFVAGDALAWSSAELQGSVLWVQNRSGKLAQARILNAQGKALLAVPFGESLSLPRSELPRGLFVLQVDAQGMGHAMRRSFQP